MGIHMQDEVGKFGNLAKSVVPVPEFREAEVEIVLNDGTFETYVEQEYMLLEMCQGNEVPPIEDLRQLMYDLIYLRVAYVRGQRLPFDIRGTRFVIPAFLSAILTSLGKVESDEFGFILIPNLPKPVNDGDVVVEKRSLEEIYQEVVRLSRAFRSFFDQSKVDYATELPKPREGHVSLLTFDTQGGEVKTESKNNPPVFAVMAAILGLQHLDPIRPWPIDYVPLLSLRVTYGSMAFYRVLTYSVGDYERRKD